MKTSNSAIASMVTITSKVAAIWTGNTDKFTIWENEIFNRSVGTVYATGPPLPGDLPETPVTISRVSGRLLAGGRPIRARYALADRTLELEGKAIAQDPNKGMVLYRVNGPLRQASHVTGVYGDTWSGRNVTYTRFDCKGGTLAVQLQSDPNLFTRPNAVTAESGKGPPISVLVRQPVPVRGTTTMRLPLRPSAGHCTVRFVVDDVAVPAVVLGPPNTDTRALGVHFNRFTYRPPR